MKKNFLLSFSILFFVGLSLAQTTSPSPYCNADFDDQQGFPVADAINSVSLSSLKNVTNGQYAFPHYVFYNNLPVPSLVKNKAYTLTVVFNVLGGNGYGVWIDYNHNNIFEASEKVSGTTSANPLAISSNTMITQSITVPTSALSGNTRMRVRIVEDDNYTLGTNGYSILPCNLSTSQTDVMDWGETEDYTINIAATTPISLTDFVASHTPEAVKLSWLASEDQQGGFYVERSNDGTLFSPIAFIDANVASTTNTAYQYTDKTAFTGKNYYRIKMMDRSGGFSYSNTLMINKELEGPKYFIYPNPVKDVLTLYGSDNMKHNIAIYDIFGRMVERYNLNSSTRFEVSRLEKGQYVFKIDNSAIKFLKW